jgi:hypothetical protein
MRTTSLFIIILLMINGCGSSTTNHPQEVANTANDTNKSINTNLLDTNSEAISPRDVDNNVTMKFGMDDTQEKVSSTQKTIAGNWFGNSPGKHKRFKIYLQLRKDGSYKFLSRLALGKFYNVYRVTEYSGKWELKNSNSQIVLHIKNDEAPLILSNRFPVIQTPAGITLYPGGGIDTDKKMDIDESKDVVSAVYSKNVDNYMHRKINDFNVDYFTMVAPKANSEKFWGEIKPKGYLYGHKMNVGSDDWNYALKRIENDSDNYIFSISDESWQTLVGGRKNFADDIQDPKKLFLWFEFWKDQMQILGKVKGTVIYMITGDAPPRWAGDIRVKYGNDPKNVPAKIVESRFPEALERNVSQSFAGVFQLMDYIRMKYAPNVKLSYTLKTWGIQQPASGLFDEPDSGWDDDPAVNTMAEYLNNFGVEFDLLTFNYNPRGGSHSDEEYLAAAKYFGAISKKMNSRDASKPKLWIWKVSLWNTTQPSFLFRNIDKLVSDCNAIGMTLGHGNDLTKQSGFEDDTDKGIYIKSWMIEYFKNKTLDTVPDGKHATQGLVYWR